MTGNKIEFGTCYYFPNFLRHLIRIFSSTGLHTPVYHSTYVLNANSDGTGESSAQTPQRPFLPETFVDDQGVLVVTSATRYDYDEFQTDPLQHSQHLNRSLSNVTSRTKGRHPIEKPVRRSKSHLIKSIAHIQTLSDRELYEWLYALFSCSAS